MKFNSGWYVLYVKSRCENKVYKSLNEISIESFLPQVKVIRQWSDRKKMILKPLFPSYVFVNIKSFLEYHKVLSVNGACAYVCFGNEYPRVSEKEITQIKFLIGMKGVLDIEINDHLPRAGEMKSIKSGLLKGVDCEIIKADNSNKIIVRIDSLRQNIIATIPLCSFESIV